MEKEKFSYPVSLRRMQITDKFWKNEMELVRTEVIPYQWNALNDKVEGAAPSYCMHNFKVAAEMNRQKRKQGAAYKEPSYTYRGFEMLPEDPENLKDEFYGYVFQDTDFSKWVEAVGYSLTQHPDPDLEKVADAAIDIVCAAQQEDGYLDTYYIINGKDGIFTNLRDHHELYFMRQREKINCFMRRNDSRITLQIISDRRKENARDIRDMKLQKWHSSVFTKLQENKSIWI